MDVAPSDRTRVRRMPKRGAYDRAAIDAILDAGLLCHVGYVVEGQPYVTPTAHWRDGDYVYWHGSSASRMLRTLVGGVEVCVTVSMLDGLVLARSGFHHSMNYRAVMALGRAELVEGDHKLHALKMFSDRLVPGRWETLRPPTTQELKATTILRLELTEASAKIRTGQPVDDDEDYALPVWAGVLPLSVIAGAPIPDPRLAPGTPLPANIAQFTPEGVT
ncbi:pyridoxamine 5'-phosphate oxidase family protein [Acidisphaera sp. L21]|uniref:pyridoxamine 5'-phosphate oxidase family protein n=1 Tax=Acidisphaera sp. L21 TaxID=1641851 RepID=UPI00131DCEAA|nr:pyridoxamine 5'-phosphate oxidase family protein [Acidisphaera sp. L21]